MAVIIYITLVTTAWFTQRKRNGDKLTKRDRRKFYSGLSWKSDCVISVISFFHFFLFISSLPCSLILLKNTAATGSVYTGMGCVKSLTHLLQQVHEVCNTASSEKVEPLSSSRAGPQSLCQAIESPRVVLESAASDSLGKPSLVIYKTKCLQWQELGLCSLSLASWYREVLEDPRSPQHI